MREDTKLKCATQFATMKDKNPWNGYEKPSFHILNLSNVQMQHNMHVSNHLDTATGPPLPPSNNVGMKKHCQDRVKCTGVHKLQHCLGERGKGGKGQKLRQIVLIVLTILSSIVQHMQTYGTRSESNNIVIQSLYSHS